MPSSSVSATEGVFVSAASAATDTFRAGEEKVGEITQEAVDRVRQSSLVQRLVVPPARYAFQKYNESPMFIKCSMATFAAMSIIPVSCFLGFLGVVAVGLLVFGVIAFAVVEGGLGIFASLFLLPALGISCLIAGGVGLTALLTYAAYRLTTLGVGVIMGPREQVALERKGQRIRSDLDASISGST